MQLKPAFQIWVDKGGYAPEWQGKQINGYGILFKQGNQRKLIFDNIVITTNHQKQMFINRNNGIHYISKIEKPHRIWYPINFQIPRYGEDYVKSKVGVTDRLKQRDLRIEFYEAIRNAEIRTDEVEYHVLRFDNTDYPIYLYQEYANVITVFMEKGLFSLGENRPGGYGWAIIYEKDTPNQIQAKFYDHRQRFGVAMHKKLKKLLGW